MADTGDEDMDACWLWSARNYLENSASDLRQAAEGPHDYTTPLLLTVIAHAGISNALTALGLSQSQAAAAEAAAALQLGDAVMVPPDSN